MAVLLAKNYIQVWKKFENHVDPEGELWGYEYRHAIISALALAGARYRISNPSRYVLLEFDRDADATMFILKWS